MNPENIHNALNYLDDDLIAETDALRQGTRVRRRSTVRKVISWAVPAACLVLVLGAGTQILPALAGGSTSSENGALEMEAAQSPGEMQDQMLISESGVHQNESKTEYALQTVSCGNISIEIPETWDHELVKEDGGGYFIVIRPPYEQGCVRVGYWPNFGVCGTGLTEEKTVIAGMNATVGTYDGSDVWSFITFGDDYVAINEGADAWWGKYGKLLMECLETLVIE